PVPAANTLAALGFSSHDRWETFYESQTDPTIIEADVAWLETEATIAYAVLGCRYFHTFGDTVRRDLEEGFKRIEERFYESVRKEVSNEVAEKLFSQVERIAESIRKGFTMAGLDVLIKHGTAADIPLAKKFLFHPATEVQTRAIDLLSRIGSASDIQALTPL